MVEPVKVVIHTSYGSLTAELYPDRVPRTVENFLQYVRDRFYDKTLFHRVIDDFIIQGGGFQVGMVQKSTRPPIPNEAENGLRNERGTIAVARRADDPHSGTAQFFINTRDNDVLNFRDTTADKWGYCAFGRIVEGMEIVDRIEGVPTVSKGPHQGVPTRDVLIEGIQEFPAP